MCIRDRDHEGQVVIHHAQHHGPLGIDHPEKADVRSEDVVVQGNQPDLPEQLIQKTVVFQNCHPGIGPQQEVYPHGQHNEHHGQPLEPGALLAHFVGHGVADKHADGGGNEGQLEGAGEHHGVGAHFGEVIQRKAADRGGKRVNDHHDDRGHHEQRHPDHIGDGEAGKTVILHPRSPPHPTKGWRRPAHRIPQRRRNNRRTYRSRHSSS